MSLLGEVATESKRKRSKLASSALVAGIVGVIFLPLSVVGAGLGIAALFAMKHNPSLHGRGAAIAGIALLVPAMAVAGIIASIALPAFASFSTRSKTAEAPARIMEIQRGIEAYVERQSEGPGHMALLLPAISRTPASPPCQAEAWPVSASGKWNELGFEPKEPLRYSYEVVHTGGTEYRIRAYGDLNCDGKESLFELAGKIEADGTITLAKGIYTENELE